MILEGKGGLFYDFSTSTYTILSPKKKKKKIYNLIHTFFLQLAQTIKLQI